QAWRLVRVLARNDRDARLDRVEVRLNDWSSGRNVRRVSRGDAAGRGLRSYRHWRAPFFQAYPRPSARMAMKITINQYANCPTPTRASAQGKMKTASTSKTTKRIA